MSSLSKLIFIGLDERYLVWLAVGVEWSELIVDELHGAALLGVATS